MERLLIEIIVITLVSLVAFVLGAIIGSGKRRNEEEEALIGSLGLPPLNKHKLRCLQLQEPSLNRASPTDRYADAQPDSSASPPGNPSYNLK